MKSIKWTGDARELPGIGVVNRGDIVSVPERVAESYIKQGLATKQDHQSKPTSKGASK